MYWRQELAEVPGVGCSTSFRHVGQTVLDTGVTCLFATYYQYAAAAQHHTIVRTRDVKPPRQTQCRDTAT